MKSPIRATQLFPSLGSNLSDAHKAHHAYRGFKVQSESQLRGWALAQVRKQPRLWSFTATNEYQWTSAASALGHFETIKCIESVSKRFQSDDLPSAR